jgi:hypothetical protein
MNKPKFKDSIICRNGTIVKIKANRTYGCEDFLGLYADYILAKIGSPQKLLTKSENSRATTGIGTTV